MHICSGKFKANIGRPCACAIEVNVAAYRSKDLQERWSLYPGIWSHFEGGIFTHKENLNFYEKFIEICLPEYN